MRTGCWVREITLKEWEWSEPVTLSVYERDALRQAVPLNAIAPVAGSENDYRLRPGSTIGAVEVGDLSVLIEPKIGIPQVLSLACYAIGKVHFREEDFDFREEEALPDALAIALARQARLAFARGLLHGYRTEEEALHTVRGRIRFDEQLRRRYGIPLPVEVRYDEFTDDVLPNQLVKAAAYRLGRTRPRSARARRGLGWLAAILEEVSPVEFPPNDVPAVRFDRLNEHYRGVVELSRLILRHGAFEAGRGAMRASGFLMDMNAVFQEFVTVALREELKTSTLLFREKSIGSLDHENRTSLRPDLTWWEGSSCVFVGDVKYKNLIRDGDQNDVPESDLYQMLAYVTASNLPGGLLVYAKGEAKPARYTIRNTGEPKKRLEVAALDLFGTLDQVLNRVKGLSREVMALRGRVRSGRSQ